MSTSVLRECGMCTDRRPAAPGPIVEEGGGAGGDQTSLSESGHVCVREIDARSVWVSTDVTQGRRKQEPQSKPLFILSIATQGR